MSTSPDPWTRSFTSPSGRTWTVTEERAALRFTSGDLVLELAPWPPDLATAGDELLVVLARLAQPPRFGRHEAPAPRSAGPPR